MPSLNVLSDSGRSDADYLRLFDRALLHWLRHFGDEADIEVGVAFASPGLPHLADANTLLDFALPEGISAAAAMKQVEAHYARAGAPCRRIIAHPDLSGQSLTAAGEALAAAGYQPGPLEALVLERASMEAALEIEGFTIIPARASYRHAVAFEQAGCDPQHARETEEAVWLHLDDPRYDALVAIDAQGQCAGSAGMLAIGEVGLLRNLRVAPAHREGRLPEVLLGRAVEIAARSLFRHVLAGADTAEAELKTLLSRNGFRPVGNLRAFTKAP